MPVFEYKCKSCGEKYEIFHHTKEIIDDVICPECNSPESEKLLSTFSASTTNSKAELPEPSPCASCCNGPSCGHSYN